MTAQQIDIFRTIGPTMLPRLIDADQLESIDDYGDYAILTYNLAKPVPIKDALDDMEDNMDLNILYHVESFSTTKRGDHCCAYSVPTSGRMYKLNAQTGADKRHSLSDSRTELLCWGHQQTVSQESSKNMCCL